MEPKKSNHFLYVLILILIVIIIVLLVRKNNKVEQHQHADATTQQMDFSNELKEIENLEKLVKENPQDYESILKLAHLYQDTGQLEKSIVKYKQYLEKFPDNADARIDLGVSYYQLAFEDESRKNQLFTDAITEMETALKYEPKHQLGHFNLGIVNLQNGNMEKARKWFKECISINPNSQIAQKAMEILQQHITSPVK